MLIEERATERGSVARTVELQGHRGARGLAPENTLDGFARAASIGVDTIELDIGLSADSVVVVHHDTTLNPDTTRDAHGRWIEQRTPIRALSVAELKQLDVGAIRPGSEYQRRFPHQIPHCGVRIPTLAESFAWAATDELQQLRFNIEVKCEPQAQAKLASPAQFVAALMADIDRFAMRDRVTVQSFDWRIQYEMERAWPAFPGAFLTCQQPFMDTVSDTDHGPSAWLAGHSLSAHGGSVVKLVHGAGARVWCPHHLDLNASARALARTLGLRVWVWTVNEPQHLERVLDLEVDAIITDYPDRARAAMTARGIALPNAHRGSAAS